ncbi:MAG: hypothetical protein AAGD25_02445 [Cyanobacteria bacterium P01_F01_bin.150]
MKLSSKGKELVRLSLTNKEWTLENLAEASNFSISTVKKFSAGANVRDTTFARICATLGIEWKPASYSQMTVQKNEDNISELIEANPSGDQLSINSLNSQKVEEFFIRNIQKKCRQKIINYHHDDVILNGDSIDINQLYVDVYFFEKPENRYFHSAEGLLKRFRVQEDRLILSKRLQNIPGLNTATTNSKLIILGKPGAGKTFFLKHLAAKWCSGEFHPESILILIQFEFIKNDFWNMLNTLDQELGLKDSYEVLEIENKISEIQVNILRSRQENNNYKDGARLFEAQFIEDRSEYEEKSVKLEKKIFSTEIRNLSEKLGSFPLVQLLAAGKLVVLMDGFDRIPTEELRVKVQEQIIEISNKYPKNKFIITSRTQKIPEINNFNYFEISKFNHEQIKNFICNWFNLRNKSETYTLQRWEEIRDHLIKYPELNEVASNPLFLSLICLVFEDNDSFPSDLAWFYQKCIQLMLKPCIDRRKDSFNRSNEIYQSINSDEKEMLLMQIAANKFVDPNNFVFFEQEDLVRQISNYFHLNSSSEGLEVLRNIETQHGLLIERADGIWSFSHFSFQEYFVIQWLKRLTPEALVDVAINETWQKALTRLAQSHQSIDKVLKLIKEAGEQLVFSELKIQNILQWIYKRHLAIRSNHKSYAVRAFYYISNLIINVECVDELNLDFHSLSPNKIALKLDPRLDQSRVIELDRFLFSLLFYTRKYSVYEIVEDSYKYFEISFKYILQLSLDPEFSQKIKEFQSRLIEIKKRGQDSKSVIKDYSMWKQDLRKAILSYRDLGHEWKLTDEQQEKLKRYYEVNKFLLYILTLERRSSRELRSHIISTLFLPWIEIQHRLPYLHDRIMQQKVNLKPKQEIQISDAGNKA